MRFFLLCYRRNRATEREKPLFAVIDRFAEGRKPV
jgi:hypothetical protein